MSLSSKSLPGKWLWPVVSQLICTPAGVAACASNPVQPFLGRTREAGDTWKYHRCYNYSNQAKAEHAGGFAKLFALTSSCGPCRRQPSLGTAVHRALQELG